MLDQDLNDDIDRKWKPGEGGSRRRVVSCKSSWDVARAEGGRRGVAEDADIDEVKKMRSRS